MQRLLAGILLGIVVTLLLGTLLAYLAITGGMVPAAGDLPAGRFEKWAAHTALKATLKRQANQTSSLPASQDNLLAGAKIYATNCAGCHGTPLDADPKFGQGFIPGPTLFGKGDLVSDDPEGYIFWKIKHDIKFTGMPSFTPSLNDHQMWQVAMFLKHMDKLPPAVDTYWKAMK